ncbi:MAG: Mov34/MPN/PAD-1 family protein [Candidatus Acidiferrales bacterium]
MIWTCRRSFAGRLRRRSRRSYSTIDRGAQPVAPRISSARVFVSFCRASCCCRSRYRLLLVAGEIQLTKNVAAEILRHARGKPSHECCGLLGGCGGAITRAFAASNAAAQPATAYEIAPEELFRLMREIRTAELDLRGIYHSHPTGENEPSPRDIECAYYPEAAYFILSPQPTSLKPIRAFSFRDGRAAELDVQIV